MSIHKFMKTTLIERWCRYGVWAYSLIFAVDRHHWSWFKSERDGKAAVNSNHLFIDSRPKSQRK